MTISVSERDAPKNIQLLTEDFGDPTSDRRLVLLHGLGSSTGQFSNLFELVDHDIYLLAVTLPAHDRNVLENSDLELSFEIFSDLVIELCDRLGIHSANFCGISMGSAIALKVAAKRPDLCNDLIVIRPAWLTERKPKNLQLIGIVGDLFAKHSADKVLELLEASSENKELELDVPGAAQSLRSIVTRPMAELHAPVLSAMYNDAPFRRLNELRSIRNAVVVIGTNADPLHPVEFARQTVNALPNARLEILPPRYLDPEAYQAAFLRVVVEALGIPKGELK